MAISAGVSMLTVSLYDKMEKKKKKSKKEVRGCQFIRAADTLHRGGFLSTYPSLLQLGLQLVRVCVERRLCSYLFLTEGLWPL